MEIEIRAFIDNVPTFVKRLEELGARLESRKHIIDHWYCNEECTNFNQVQQNEPGSYALRIRRTLTDNQTINEINCKVLTNRGDHNAFEEYESKFENFNQMKSILGSIGFKIFGIVDKKRTIYRFDNCTINIEDIKNFRPAVELEIISDKNPEKHKTDLRNLLVQLGVKEEDKIEKSITYLYMEQFSFKDF